MSPGSINWSIWQLYRAGPDSGQQHNLAPDSEFAAVLEELVSSLDTESRQMAKHRLQFTGRTETLLEDLEEEMLKSLGYVQDGESPH